MDENRHRIDLLAKGHGAFCAYEKIGGTFADLQLTLQRPGKGEGGRCISPHRNPFWNQGYRKGEDGQISRLDPDCKSPQGRFTPKGFLYGKPEGSPIGTLHRIKEVIKYKNGGSDLPDTR